MLKIGDTVKLVGTTGIIENGVVVEKELIPIGTICEVTSIDNEEEKTLYGVTSKNGIKTEYWYYEEDLEKGSLEWVKEE